MLAQRAAQAGPVAHIAVKGDLLADRLALVLGDDRALVQAAGVARKVIAVLTKAAHEVGLGPGGQLADGGDA